MKGWSKAHPWDKYSALKAKGRLKDEPFPDPINAPETKAAAKAEPKAEAATDVAPVPQTATPPSPPPAANLEGDAQASLSEAVKANPPKQWDQPGGPPAPGPTGNEDSNPPSLPSKADRRFSSKEITQIMKDAKDAIAKGAPRDKVAQRLRENGIDPAGLDDNGGNS
jgi:hypothetical protein